MTFTDLIPKKRSNQALLISGVIVGMTLRIHGVMGELNTDEAFTWRNFAKPGYAEAITSYFVPNNHIFHSILVRASTQLLGPEDWVIRLPSLVAGVLALPAIFSLSQALFRRMQISLLCLWFFALSPHHISISSTARGYSLAVLFSILSAHLFLPKLHRTKWVNIAFVVSCFLATYTIPSTALHVLVLGVWSGIIYRNDVVTRRKIAWMFGLLFVLICAAYWPLRSQLTMAASIFGIDVWSDPTSLLQVIGDTGSLLAGGILGLPPTIFALFGLAYAARHHKSVATYVILVWTLPFAICLFAGTATAPRGYVFLLPSFAFLFGLGLSELSNRHKLCRTLLPIAALVAYSWTASGRISANLPYQYQEVSRYLATQGTQPAFTVTPTMMEESVYHYGGNYIKDNLLACIKHHAINKLIFFTHATDKRFQLSNYWLWEERGMRSGLQISETTFSKKFTSGNIELFEHIESGRKIFPHDGRIGWNPDPNYRPKDFLFKVGPPGLSEWQSIAIENPTGERYGIIPESNITFPTLGVAALIFCATDSDSHVELFRTVSDGDTKRTNVQETLMISLLPTEHTEPKGQRWYIRTGLVPVNQIGEYSIYVSGTSSIPHRIADILCYFFPVEKLRQSMKQ